MSSSTGTVGSGLAAKDARTSCGFCEGGHGRCKGTWPHFVRATDANPDGSWTCACSAAGHRNQEEAKAS